MNTPNNDARKEMMRQLLSNNTEQLDVLIRKAAAGPLFDPDGNSFPIAPEKQALIVKYALIMLADSVSVKSDQFFSESVTSQVVQAYFIQQAILELRSENLL